MVDRLSILIPAFNEELSIISVLSEVYSAEYGIPFEVIVIDDGSTDKTTEKVRKFIKSKTRARFPHSSSPRPSSFRC